MRQDNIDTTWYILSKHTLHNFKNFSILFYVYSENGALFKVQCVMPQKYGLCRGIHHRLSSFLSVALVNLSDIKRCSMDCRLLKFLCLVNHCKSLYIAVILVVNTYKVIIDIHQCSGVKLIVIEPLKFDALTKFRLIDEMRQKLRFFESLLISIGFSMLRLLLSLLEGSETPRE